MINKLHEDRICAILALAGWDEAKVRFTKEPVGGTNTSYFAEYDDIHYVIRIAANDSGILSIDRRAERAAISIASEKRVGARLVCFDETTGDMITFQVAGRTPTDTELQDLSTTKRLANALQLLHGNCAGRLFDPFLDIQSRLSYLRAEDKKRILRNDSFEQSYAVYESAIAHPPEGLDSECYTGLCHNDPCINNIILGEQLLLIDYEFAGMGSVFFDLASVCGLWNAEKRKQFLAAYFGRYDESHLKYLQFYTVVQLLWNATWGYVKHFGDAVVAIDYVTWSNEQLQLAVRVIE